MTGESVLLQSRLMDHLAIPASCHSFLKLQISYSTSPHPPPLQDHPFSSFTPWDQDKIDAAWKSLDSPQES